MKYDVNNLKYIILPGKYPEDPQLHTLHNQAYLYWQNFWNNVFRENGSKDTVCADNFWRQDMVTMLMHENEIIAQHLYSFFNIKSLAAINHTYFTSIFNDEYFKKLKNRQSYSVMSMEYFAVSPHWRKKNCGISLASVLIGLACKHQTILLSDALIGPSRSDLKVTQLTTEYGGDIIVSGLSMHNTPVDLIAIFKDKAKPHPDFNVQRLVNKLWQERTNFVNIDRYINKKVAA